MKKLCTVVVSLTLMTLLVGCGGSDKKRSSKKPEHHSKSVKHKKSKSVHKAPAKKK